MAFADRRGGLLTRAIKSLAGERELRGLHPVLVLNEYRERSSVRRMQRVLEGWDGAPTHTGEDVAYVLEFTASAARLHLLEADRRKLGPAEGDVARALEACCIKIATKALPQRAEDLERLIGATPAAGAVPIGSHIGVPLYDASRSLAGMIGCFSFERNDFLDREEHRLLRLLSRAVRLPRDAAPAEPPRPVHDGDMSAAAR